METTLTHAALPKAAELPADLADATPARVSVQLTVPRAQASREIQNQCKIGEAIAYQRIRDRWSLDQARAEKQEWVQRTYELLDRLFNSNVVADRCNDWVARLLPEYAPLEDFIELFEVEMRHRLGRLQSVLKRLRDVPDVSQAQLNMQAQVVSDPRADVLPDPEPMPERDMSNQVTLREQEGTTPEATTPDEAALLVQPQAQVAAEPAPAMIEPSTASVAASEIIHGGPVFVMSLSSGVPTFASVNAEPMSMAPPDSFKATQALAPAAPVTSTSIRSSAARSPWTLGEFDPIL